MEKFKNYLYKNGLRCTTERLDVAKAVLSFDNLFTADELLEKIKKSDWPVSKATLYRTIPLLVEAGMIKPISLHQLNNHTFRRCDKSELIKSVKCNECGRVISINEELLNDINKMLSKKYDFEKIIEGILMLQGTCPACVEYLELLTRKKTDASILSKLRIFLFEDEQIVKSLLKYSLESSGYEVFAFNNPTEFPLNCSCNLDQKIVCADFLIVDIKMPEISGVDFVKRQIAKNCRMKKTAFISDHWTVEDLGYAKSIGAEIFYKPFSILDLTKWIESCSSEIKKERILGNEFLKKSSFSF